jgi:lipopolysaccharide/colanic/teichoic acid biosynthesis glycosyltransferase
MVYRVAKRALDFGIAALVLGLLWPVLLVVALLVRLKLGSPIIFCQERAGFGGRPFQIYKFRTMTDRRDAEGHLLPDDLRLPPFGRFLRAASLDELPQLFNVIEGHMSLVGPRPLYMRYIPRYDSTQIRRLEVVPGITGLAQISGRNAISWEEKFILDVHYVESACFLLDTKILFRTAAKVLTRSDISKDGHATMPEFMGSEGAKL